MEYRMFEILLAIFLGILLGTITGLFPGIHINLLAAILLTSSSLLLIHFSPLSIAVFIIAIAITHLFLDSLPSTFLGTPNEDYALAAYPSHHLLLQGHAYQAVVYTSLGALSAIVLLSLLAPAIIPLAARIFPIIQFLIPFLLLVTILFFLSREKAKLFALIIVLLAASLGFATLNLPVNQPLLPLLSGLFGSSILIISLKTHPEIPPQLQEFPKISKKEYAAATLSGFLAAIATGFLPTITSSQAAALAASFRKHSRETFLMLAGFTAAAFAMLSLFALFALSKTRAGFLVAISQLMESLSTAHLIIFSLTAIITASISCILAITLAKHFSKLITKLNYQKLCLLVLIFLTLLVFRVSDWLGLLIFLTASALGIITQLKNISKVNLMACLMVPTMMLYLL